MGERQAIAACRAPGPGGALTKPRIRRQRELAPQRHKIVRSYARGIIFIVKFKLRVAIHGRDIGREAGEYLLRSFG
jgi:hypothetical protein